MSYLAGVIDASATFAVNRNGAVVYTKQLPIETAKLLAETLGGVVDDGDDPTCPVGVWHLPAKAQLDVCKKLMPLLKAKRDAASVVYQYRMTQPQRKRGWQVSEPVVTFREKLMRFLGGGK